ncbi:MAG: hypothetical protein COA43_09245 [Robiginitomaculum sp.]|nr:MAG: hypothetical protein COA43_09245 [Robiginitomaculum sp.]
MSRQPIILEDPSLNLARAKTFNKNLRRIMGIVTMIGFIIVSIYFLGVRQKEERGIESRLETVTELRRAAIKRFMDSQDQETRLWARHVSIRETAQSFFDVWTDLSPQERVTIRRAYFEGAEHQEKIFANGSLALRAYQNLHSEKHQILTAFMRHHEYYDVFLFNMDGDLVYSVEKEADFAFNFSALGGKYKETGLGRAFRRALKTKDKKSIFVDFSPYAPSNGDGAAFLARPILDTNGRVIGVYAIQVPSDNFNAKLQYASGLGETGETYIVGEDMLMRNNSRLLDNPTALTQTVDTLAVKLALKGQNVLATGKNLQGHKSYIAGAPMDFNGTRWAVVTEMESSELWAPFNPYFVFYALALLFVFLFGILQYWLLRIRTGEPTIGRLASHVAEKKNAPK